MAVVREDWRAAKGGELCVRKIFSGTAWCGAQEFNVSHLSSTPSADAQEEGRPVMHELLPVANPGGEGEAQNLVCLSDEKGKETATML